MRRVLLLVLIVTVASAQEKAKPTRRYEAEFLYTIHKKLTAENYDRIERLFGKTWPKLDLSKLTPQISGLREYFAIHRGRLLEQAGTSWAKIQQGVLRGRQPTPELQKACRERAFEVVKPQADREVRLRGIYWYLRDQAAEDERASLKRIFDKLRAHDDPKSPVLSTEPGKGLIVYLCPDHPLTREEIVNIEDTGVKFTRSALFPVAQVFSGSPPKVSAKARVFGSAGQGRMVSRLVRVVQSETKRRDAQRPPKK